MYCSPMFSSLWQDELTRHEGYVFNQDPDYESNKQKLFDWLTNNLNKLHQLNVLGGEPLYQIEFDQLLDILDSHPAPNLTLAFSTNLFVPRHKLINKIEKIEFLIKQNKLKKLVITASIDCWGEEAKFARYPLNPLFWEPNFNYLIDKSWITLCINSTITPITIKSLYRLFEKINEWDKIRTVHWHGNSVKEPDYMLIDMFGNIFEDDFNRAIDLMPTQSPEQLNAKEHLKDIREQVKQSQPDLTKIKKLCIFLNNMDQRRGTNWRSVYPWLEELFQQHLGGSND